MKEISINIREFKSRLSHYLQLAKSGQSLEIRERQTPIGRFIPTSLPIQDRLEAMAQSGLLLLAKERLKRRKPIAKVRGKGTVADLIVENRE